MTQQDVIELARWSPGRAERPSMPFLPARVVMQDFTGVPAIVDLAAMRAAMARLGGNPAKINPLVPVDVVIDHSVAAVSWQGVDVIAWWRALGSVAEVARVLGRPYSSTYHAIRSRLLGRPLYRRRAMSARERRRRRKLPTRAAVARRSARLGMRRVYRRRRFGLAAVPGEGVKLSRMDGYHRVYAPRARAKIAKRRRENCGCPSCVWMRSQSSQVDPALSPPAPAP